MAELFYWGNLVLGLLSLWLFIEVLRTYRQKKNPLSTYLMIFFLFDGIGWIGVFLLSPLGDNVTNSWGYFAEIAFFCSIVGFCAISLFTSKVMEFPDWFRYGGMILLPIAAILHQAYRVPYVFYIALTMNMIFFIVVFTRIYLKQGDGKSLGFSIAFCCVFIAMIFNFSIPALSDVGGIILFVAAAALLAGFHGLLDRSPPPKT